MFMKIDTVAGTLFRPDTDKPSAADAGSGSFAEMLAASVESKDGVEEAAEQSDLDFIREHGFDAYAEKVEEQKKEELRERILSRMGLSEEDLEDMPAEQRADIEKLIAEEIQRRMQANAALENDKPGVLGDAPDLARDIADTTGTGSAGSVLLAAMEARDVLAEKSPAPVGDQDDDK
jgi:hypothetical protein